MPLLLTKKDSIALENCRGYLTIYKKEKYPFSIKDGNKKSGPRDNISILENFVVAIRYYSNSGLAKKN